MKDPLRDGASSFVGRGESKKLEETYYVVRHVEMGAPVNARADAVVSERKER